VVSVGTLFQAALLPGIMLALLYALYAFGYAMLYPDKAPAVEMGGTSGEPITRREGLTWLLFIPAALIGGAVVLGNFNVVGSQNVIVSSFTDTGEGATLRTNVSEQCQVSMIELHGQEKWDTAVAEQSTIDAGGGVAQSIRLSDEELSAARIAKIAAAAPIGTGVTVLLLIMSIILAMARGISPSSDPRPLIAGAIGVILVLLGDVLLVSPLTSPGMSLLILALPAALVLWACRVAVIRLSKNELIRVVFPPLVLIVAVLGSILGGITNPTPAAALGAGGAIMLAAYRKLRDQGGSGKIILGATFAIIITILIGINFDLRVNQDNVGFENWVAFIIA